MWDLTISTVGVLFHIAFLHAQEFPVEEKFACYGNVLNVHCAKDHMLVFESAQYGRNSQQIAKVCGTRYSPHCSIPVQNIMNKKCGGKQSCSVPVPVPEFGDPCGHEEFLMLRYRCIPVSSVSQGCPKDQKYAKRAFIASPDYPSSYYRDAHCFWSMKVQPTQTIRVTIYDFEMDIKRGGACLDYLEIKDHTGKVYFQDCGHLGKQEINISSWQAHVRFTSSISSLTARGFFISLQAVGKGCKNLPALNNRHVEYSIVGNKLFANVSCQDGFRFYNDDSSKRIYCQGSHWSDTVGACMAVAPITVVPFTGTTPDIHTHAASGDPSSTPSVGIILGFVAAILLITVLIAMFVYFFRRRRRRERKSQRWRMVINNLQDDNQDNEGNQNIEDTRIKDPDVHTKTRVLKKNRGNAEDVILASEKRHLASPFPDEDEDTEDGPSCHFYYEDSYNLQNSYDALNTAPRKKKKNKPMKPQSGLPSPGSVGSFKNVGRMDDFYQTPANETLRDYSDRKKSRARSGVLLNKIPRDHDCSCSQNTLHKSAITKSAPDLTCDFQFEDKPFDRRGRDSTRSRSRLSRDSTPVGRKCRTLDVRYSSQV